MREVLISIQPRWVEKIVSGEKTVEVRKTRPKCETPFKCYIYCTQGKLKDLGIIGNEIYQKRMKVIGEFVCDKIYNLSVALDPIDCTAYFPDGLDHTEGTCLTKEELAIYLCGGKWSGKGYGLNITDLVVYDKPRELSEFSAVEKKSCPAYLNGTCLDRTQNQVIRCEHLDCEHKKITRSPQSWQFCVATEPRQTAD